MAERFHCADLHFGHKTIIMVEEEGKPVRPWGRAVGRGAIEAGLMTEEEANDRVEQMNEAIIDRWNRVVGPCDKVEVMGDVVFGRHNLPLLGRLNGKKRLRLGNHENLVKNHNRDYWPYFTEITAYKELSGPGYDLLLSHIPIHPMEIGRWTANVHGHLHSRRVMRRNPVMDIWLIHGEEWRPEPEPEIPDPDYLCVSMEQIDYTPISTEEVLARLQKQKEDFLNGKS